MYTQFFGLTCKPFGVSPDPRFLYCGSRLKQTLAAMSSRFQYPGGVIVLTGEVGSGKTTVLNHMARNYPLLCYKKPALSIKKIFRNINEKLGLSGDFPDLPALSCQIAVSQNKSSTEKSYKIFAFDEVHNYPDQVVMDLVRLQDAVGKNGGKFTIILVGDEELVGKIARLDLENKVGHISYYTVENLDLKSVRAMIDHRLHIAGSSLLTVFGPGCIDEIYRFSEGVPRLVNNICELSLIMSFTKQEEIVSRESVITAARKIVNLDGSMPSSKQQKTNNKEKQSKKAVPDPVLKDNRLPEKKNFFAKVEWACSILIALLFLGLTYQPFRTKALQEIAVDSDAGHHETLGGQQDQSHKLPDLGHSLVLETYPEAISINEPETPIIHIREDSPDNTTGLPDVAMQNRKPVNPPEMEKTLDTIAQSKMLATLSDFHEKKLPVIPKKNKSEPPAKKKNTNIIARQSEPSVPQQATKKAVILAKKKTERSSAETNVLKKRPEFKEPVSVQPPQQLKLGTNVALSKAIKNNDTALVRHLLMQGNDPNSANEKNLPLLIVACQQGYLEIAKLLLEKGASTAAKNQLGETALMKSVWNGNKKMVLLLLEHGADVNQRNTDGCSSLLYAGITGHYELAEILLDHGANPNLSDNDGKTPLMAAAWNGHINIVDLLLKKHVDLNRMDKSHWTALMFAGFQGHKKIFDLLTTAGANPYLKNSEGSNAVDLALSQRHGEFSRYALN